MLAAALVLSANDFAPFSAALDQSTRTALITKYANNWAWVDFAYKGLPVYYPPLPFWIVGRIAALLSIAPWKMLKVDLLATAFLVPVLGWPLWRRVVGRTAGIGAVIGGVLLFQPWYRPHAWLGVALFIPWWVWGSSVSVGSRPDRGPRSSSPLCSARRCSASSTSRSSSGRSCSSWPWACGDPRRRAVSHCHPRTRRRQGWYSAAPHS